MFGLSHLNASYKVMNNGTVLTKAIDHQSAHLDLGVFGTLALDWFEMKQGENQSETPWEENHLGKIPIIGQFANDHHEPK